MTPGSVIAAVEHGPGMHGGIIAVVLVVAVIGSLIYSLVTMSRGRSRRNPGSDRDRDR